MGAAPWIAALRRAAPALGLFAAARLSGLLVLVAAAHHRGISPRARLATAWDADWYTRIAAHGYGRTLFWPDGTVQSDLAFFPLHPALIRAVTTVLPVTGGTAGLLVSWTAAAAAACGIYLLGERLYGRRVGTVLVLLWGLLPHSVVLTMAYTEPVMTAFAAWSLWAVVTRRWVWAGSLALLAGLSRPNAVAVAAAVMAAAGWELWRRGWRARRPWAGALLAPLGWCGYVLWVGAREGDVFGGYFAVQAGWTSRFDFGAGSLAFVERLTRVPHDLGFPMAALITGVFAVLLALYVLDRPSLPLAVYSAVLVVIAVGGAGYFESKPRFLLPAFPLLLPVALALTRARPRAAVAVTVALAGLSFGYGAYLLTLATMAL
ncbi:glycosyltransferase family 39 protein [Streptomyces sp. Edi4]|uniref:glycosyltransferase family 39 protein n=1 Tax=Streptomyces sp. Edi4 TaxID=3162527 RepID=UPI003305F057